LSYLSNHTNFNKSPNTQKIMLTDEQAQQIKEQLLSHLDQFPEDKQEQIKKEVTTLSNEKLEEFVKQNQLAQQPGQEGQPIQQQCIFCAIAENKISSYKIAENPDNIAILEINPLTKAHVLIVPKQHTENDVSESSKQLAQQLANKIKQTFQPKDVQINQTKIMNHSLLEIIPIYEEEQNKQLERKKADEKELKEIQQQLTQQEPTKMQEKPIPKHKSKPKPKPLTKLKPRIP